MKNLKWITLFLAAVTLTGCNTAVSVPEFSPAESTASSVPNVTTADTPQITEPAVSQTQSTANIPSITEAFSELGCGGQKPASPSKQIYSTFLEIPYEMKTEDYFDFGLTDKAFADLVDKRARETVLECQEQNKLLQKLSEQSGGSISAWDDDPTDPRSLISGFFQNGYLILNTSLIATYPDASYIPFYAKTLVFDCINKKELTLPELFYDGTDFMKEINRIVEVAIQKPLTCGNDDTFMIEQKRPFSGLTADSFSLNFEWLMPTITVKSINPFFTHGFSASLPDRDSALFFIENCVLFHERNCDGIFSTDIEIGASDIWDIGEFEEHFAYANGGSEGNVNFEKMLSWSDVWDQSKLDAINSLAKSLVHDKSVQEDCRNVTLRAISADKSPAKEDEALFLSITPNLTYNFFTVSIEPFCVNLASTPTTRCFDADTLEPLSTKDMMIRIFGGNYTETIVPNYEYVTYTHEDLVNMVDSLMFQEVECGSTVEKPLVSFANLQNKEYDWCYEKITITK